jgi:hypothetical protein
LLISFFILAFSGLTIAIKYHQNAIPLQYYVKIEDMKIDNYSDVENHSKIEDINVVAHTYFLGLTYFDWNFLHRIFSMIFSIAMIIHIQQHFKFYTGIIKKRLIGKHKQIIFFTIISILCAISGLICHFFFFIFSYLTKHHHIEVHEKIGFILIIFALLHILKRLSRIKQP